MKRFEFFIKSPNKTRPGLLSRVLDIVSHPALAGYTPVGPGSLATGQSAAALSGERIVLRDSNTEDHYQSPCESYA